MATRLALQVLLSLTTVGGMGLGLPAAAALAQDGAATPAGSQLRAPADIALDAAAEPSPDWDAALKLTQEPEAGEGADLAPAAPANTLELPAVTEAEALEPLEPVQRSEAFVQGSYILQDGSAARLRGSGIYVLSPSVLVGATVDLTTGDAFSDTGSTGFDLNELYLTASPASLPELRFTVGLMDLTSYLDRNSFAKDSLTHFFNPVFQTNPALSVAGVGSRPGLLVNWTPIDQLSLTATTFSSQRSLGNFSLDSFAGEVGVRLGNGILRGTYVSSRDAGRDGFLESASFSRSGEFGTLSGDREESFGLNGEWFFPQLSLGLFGRYGWYTNVDLGTSGQTFSVGANLLDVFLADDRLGLGYGRQLSNDTLRRASGAPVPDVWELFYDVRLSPQLRAGASLQQRNGFSETFVGLRLRYDLRWREF